MIINPADRIESVKEYYFSIKLKEIARLRTEGKEIINLGIGSPDLPPALEVKQEMKEFVERNDLHGYQSYVGRPELRDAISNWYKRHYRVGLNPSTQVLPLAGSKEGIMHIHMAFINPGDTVLIPNPGYPTYAASAKLAGAKIQYYDLTASNDWQPDWEQLEALDWSAIKIMWVNYPHMPTGALPHPGTFEKLVNLAQEKECLLCHDNPYSFVLNDHPQSLLETPGSMNVSLELNSLSKSHNMAGWRVGMLVGREDYLQQVLKFKSNMDSGMLAATQLAAVKALSLSSEWYTHLNLEYQKRRKVAYRLFDLLDCQYEADRAGMFVWGKIPSSWKNAFELSDFILNQVGVFITPGGIFGSNGDNYLRISLCSKIPMLELALKKLMEININIETGS